MKTASWRHQISALTDAGYRVVAPDQRGYGQTDRPKNPEAYTLCHLAGDVVGLVESLGEKRAAVIGHDWGSGVAWTCAQDPRNLLLRLFVGASGGIPQENRWRRLFSRDQLFLEPSHGDRSAMLDVFVTPGGNA
jgi:pimeloyl-ACP methyl ester carboxylesterase